MEYHPKAQEHENWMMGRANLHGRIAMILCWYWDGYEEFWEQEYAAYGVSLVRKLLIGDTIRFTNDDWWILFDPLNTYPERDKQIEEVFEVVKLGFAGRLTRGQPTRNFNTNKRTLVWYDHIERKDCWFIDP